MTVPVSVPHSPTAADLVALRQQIAQVSTVPPAVMPFDLPAIDERLAAGGIDRRGLHEIAAASAALSDDAAATLFCAGIAARLAALASEPRARSRGATVLWALTQFDLYAPGLEQVGLAPDRILYAQGARDSDVLAMAEDGLRDGSLACVIAEVKSADRTATRRLQCNAAMPRAPHRQPAGGQLQLRTGRSGQHQVQVRRDGIGAREIELLRCLQAMELHYQRRIPETRDCAASSG